MVIEYDKDLLKCNEFLPLCSVLDTPLVFLYIYLVYVVSYQKHSMTHVLYTSPLLITVVVEWILWLNSFAALIIISE